VLGRKVMDRLTAIGRGESQATEAEARKLAEKLSAAGYPVLIIRE